MSAVELLVCARDTDRCGVRRGQEDGHGQLDERLAEDQGVREQQPQDLLSERQ